MPDRSDRHGAWAPHVLTIPNTVAALGPDGVKATASPQLTMDPVTLAAGGPSASGSRPVLDPYIGSTLEGRYVVESLLGEGGMAFVYVGRHKLIGKRVAIKILRTDFAADSEMSERFLNEAKAASSIGNAHIVDISDFGRLGDGAAFFVMEFLEGSSLSEVLSQSDGAIPTGRMIHIAKQIARGLAAAHRRGVVHRDLKPDNVMLITHGEDRDYVKILDFGIAKLGSESARLTRAGSVFGTPHYMSPEQAAGIPVDRRTDVYSLGVILYEMLAGKLPFDADNFMGILTQHMYKAPLPLRTVATQPIASGLEAVVLKAMSKRVEARYGSMDEVIVDLEKVERGSLPNAVTEMTAGAGAFDVPADYFQNPSLQVVEAPRASAPRRPRRAVVGAAAGAVLLGVVGAVAMMSASRSTSPAVSATPTVSATPATEPPRNAEPAAGSASGVGTAPVAPPAKASVVVTTDPVDATIALDQDTTDTPEHQPRSVLVGADEKVTVRVERQGFKTLRHVIDGAKVDPKSPRLVLRLVREDAKPNAPVPKAAGAKATAPAPSGTTPPVVTRPASCAIDDWDPFEKRCRAKQAR